MPNDPPNALDSFGLVPIAMGAVRGAALSAAFLSVDVCLAITFVLFSKPTERQSTLFWLHIFSFACAGVFFIIEIALQPLLVLLFASENPIGVFGLGPSLVVARWNTASTFFLLFAPLVADSSLIFKLRAIYPTWAVSRPKRCLVMGPFIASIMMRFILSTLTIWHGLCLIILKIEKGESYNDAYLQTDVLSIVRLLDIGIQVLSCAYASTLIILRARHFRKQRRARDRRVDEAEPWRKLNHFVESIFMGFVPPVMCQLLFVATSIGSLSLRTTTKIQTYAGAANVFLSAFFAVLATTWSTVRDAVPRRNSLSQDPRNLSREPDQDGRRNAVAERSIISNFLDRAGGDGDDEEDIEFVGTTPSPPDEEKSTPALPTRGTSEWRTHLFRQLGSKQQPPST